ncbi:metalloprotease PmbA [Rhodanobacter thiooxydans]|uniref:Metalloprotease PmbA n=1 Tax=Rhodanobacter thiooxydans TaxID=416169 RepID=A0A154QM15_9GAMM|nr:metalloprotease PmbA [Rhodanobacter thiooxydans]EIM00168.1 putative Zn-dependent protease-like protein [Rhodanobacter thiooxydans LCS2]KZC25239.1 metalloprotease PmbA [Rhodanobacter thiooxydans]MCW0203012.1 metalloprotease PmbA [Rhodanobacter thiooxydans]
MSEVAISQDRSLHELDRLAELAEDVIRRARAAGASQAEVAASIDTGLSVNVRLGEVETVEHTRDRGFGLTVYFGQRKGSASTADLNPDSIQATLEQACAIARYTEEDPAAGLADAARMATAFPDLDLWHPWDIDTAQAIELGIAIEDAGRVHAGISNSDGASVQAGEGLSVYANSHGFVGRERGTRHALSLALIAGDEDGMQRDYWYDSVRAAGDFISAQALGNKAAERTLARLGARGLSTRQCPVLFAPELARGLVGHLLGAVSGGALYRRASFLLDHAGKSIMPAWLNIDERPHLPRGQGSGNFDAEGVATVDSALVEGGVLARYVLGSYSARKLGLESTGNAGGVHNLIVEPGAADGERSDFAGMLRRLGTGLLVTEVMGQGVSVVTGDYSRGAAGFWVENGRIAYPVEGITIAANLREMFAGIVAVGTDVDPRSHVLTGSILLDRMTVAGE